MMIVGRTQAAAAVIGFLASALAAVPLQAQGTNDPLNEAGFEAPDFEARVNVLEQHNKGLRPTNVITVPTVDENWESYWYGLLVVPLVFLVVLVGWCIGVCCQPCCRCAYRKSRKVRTYGFGAFIVFCLASMVAWGFAFGVDDKLSNGVNGLKNSIQSVIDQIGEWERVFTDASASLDNLQDQLNETVSVCEDEGADPQFLDGLKQVSTTITEEAERAQSDINSALEAFPEIESTLQQVVDEPVDTAVGTVIIIWGVIMIALTLFFMLSTSVMFLQPGGTACRGLKTCLARTSCASIFTIGLLLISLAVFLAAIIEAVSTVGADTCSPTPDATVQRLISSATGNMQLEVRKDQDVGLCEAIPGTGNGDPPPEVSILCYYQTCRGDTIIADAVTELRRISEQAGGFLNTSLSGLPPLCEDAVKVASVNATINLAAQALSIVNQFRCDKLNLIYTQVMYDSVCNGFVDATVSTWRTFLSGSILLLVALALHRHFHLGDKQDHVYNKTAYNQSTTNDADFADDDDGGANGEVYAASSGHSMLTGTVPAAGGAVAVDPTGGVADGKLAVDPVRDARGSSAARSSSPGSRAPSSVPVVSSQTAAGAAEPVAASPPAAANAPATSTGSGGPSGSAASPSGGPTANPNTGGQSLVML